jgi:hypothetical protein
MTQTFNRRSFLALASVGSAGVFARSEICPAEDRTSSNERLRFACIGVGGKGASDMADAARQGDVVAICDVDERTLEGAARRHPNHDS